MDKQSTIAFVLIGLILTVWLYFNSPQQVPPPQVQKQEVVQDSSAQTSQNQSAEKITQKNDEENKKTVSNSNKNQTEENRNNYFVKKNSERIITVETDLARIEFSTYGGNIEKFFLKKYFTWYAKDLPEDAPWYKKFVQLINYSKGNELDVAFMTKDGKYINTANVEFEAPENGYYKVGKNDSLQLIFTFDLGEGKSLKKIFTIYGNDYRSRFSVKFKGMKDVISGFNYNVVWNHGINFVEKDATDEALFANASAYAGEEQVVVDAPLDEKIEKSINGKIDWIGVRNKYFAFILAPHNPDSDGGADFKGEHIKNKWGEREYYSINFRVPIKNLNNQTDTFDFYGGPIKYDILKSYGNNFEAIFDFGSFFGLKFITRPISEYILLPLFTFLHTFIPNYGWVIIVLTILIKIALYPLTKKSYESMKKTQLLQPEIQKIKEKYKGDQQRIQKETMALYSKYGVNPAGGCLPMLLQMPILFALFTFFKVMVEIRQQPFILWIDNLSAPDVIYSLPFRIPLFGVDQISGLAVLLGITMFLQQKMTMKDPSQKAMVYIMPIMFTFMFMAFPSGLNLYYFMFNLLSIGQQYYINTHGEQKLKPVENPKKKSGFMQRMMQAAEEQQKAQKRGGKKKKK